MDRDRICHGKSVFKGPGTRGSDFRSALPVLRGLEGTGGNEIGDRETTGSPEAFSSSQKSSDAVPDVENRPVATDYEASFFRSVDWQQRKRDARLARIGSSLSINSISLRRPPTAEFTESPLAAVKTHR
jgi:hypothetical protein